MRKLYDKDPVWFALFWIGAYVVVMNIALRFCNGFDNLEEKTAGQLLVPVVCILVLAVLCTVWIIQNGLTGHFGLCRIQKNAKSFLYFLPLILMSCINLKNGLYLPAPPLVAVLMMTQLAIAGYLEEIIFRGFLFRGMVRDNLTTAILVSAVTFGAGHIVNLANTEDTLGVVLQVCYAIVIGFLYTILVYRGGSLWPCIASHVFVNGSSVFAREQGPFSDLIAAIFGSVNADWEQICSALVIILLSGGYALWLWKNGRFGELRHEQEVC